MTTILTLDRVLVDWLTITSHDRVDVVENWQKFINSHDGGRIGTNPKKWQNFNGEEYHFTDGTMFGGMGEIKNQDWLGFYYSGELAQDAAMHWKPFFDDGRVNVRRVDLQVTVQEPKDWGQINLLNRMHVSGKKTELAQSYDQKSGQNLMTVAIGSRTSEAYMRVYEKITDGNEKLLRMEGEYKGAKAEAVMRDLSSVTPTQMLKHHMQKMRDTKLENVFANSFEGISSHNARPSVKVRNKRKEWLLGSCLPAFVEFVNAHDDDGEVQAAFLEVLRDAGLA